MDGGNAADRRRVAKDTKVIKGEKRCDYNEKNTKKGYELD